MAALTIQELNKSGVTISYAAAAGGGDEFANNGKTFLHVKNGGGSPINVTIASQVDDPPPGTAASNVVIAVANGAEKMIGPFNQNGYNDTDGNVQVTYSGVTSVTVAAISV